MSGIRLATASPGFCPHIGLCRTLHGRNRPVFVLSCLAYLAQCVFRVGPRGGRRGSCVPLHGSLILPPRACSRFRLSAFRLVCSDGNRPCSCQGVSAPTRVPRPGAGGDGSALERKRARKDASLSPAAEANWTGVDAFQSRGCGHGPRAACVPGADACPRDLRSPWYSVEPRAQRRFPQRPGCKAEADACLALSCLVLGAGDALWDPASCCCVRTASRSAAGRWSDPENGGAEPDPPTARLTGAEALPARGQNALRCSQRSGLISSSSGRRPAGRQASRPGSRAGASPACRRAASPVF